MKQNTAPPLAERRTRQSSFPSLEEDARHQFLDKRATWVIEHGIQGNSRDMADGETAICKMKEDRERSELNAKRKKGQDGNSSVIT